MTIPFSRNLHAVQKPLAFASALSALSVFTFVPAFAQSTGERMLAPVVVTASRFASDPALKPIGATIIDAEDIRDAGIDNVNEAIRKLGGVYGRQGFAGTSDFSLDLRGFGSSSDQNMVILVDGVRLSENELSPALLSSVPIALVERIEIVRGGGSVLYGDGATSGIIQIITKRSREPGVHGAVTVEAGSFDHRALRTSVSRSSEGFALDAAASTQRADNYRYNSASRLDNFSGGAQWSSSAGRAGVRIDLARQDSRFPGPLSLAQFEANPRQSNTPDDFGSFDTNRYTLFAERHLGSADIAAELSHREKTAKSVYVSTFGTYDARYDSSMTQFSPRVRHLSGSGRMKNELVAGIDLARWTRKADSSFGGFPSSAGDASQRSRALYLRDEVRFGNARIAAGARHEIFDKDFSDPLGFSTTAYSKRQSLNAWELQGIYAVAANASVYAKGGQSYRIANVDENGATPVANQPLEPQISHDVEIGATLGKTARNVTVRAFRHRLTNEIFYNPLLFANVNLDPTRRQGVELEGNLRVLPSVVLSGSLQHVSASFTDGPNAGKEMALVPRNTAALRVNWFPASGQSAMVGVRWVDSQRYGGDFSNSCASRIPSFTTMDARYALKAGSWEFALSGTNLTDRSYFSNAFGACESGIYPDMGRRLNLSARLDF